MVVTVMTYMALKGWKGYPVRGDCNSHKQLYLKMACRALLQTCSIFIEMSRY
jgi:hypothetical protein